jgi:hypothetical protein
MCAFHHIASWTNGYVQYPHLAPFVNCANGKLVECLKFVEDGKKENEIEILQYFASLPSESDHCVRPFAIWSVTGGSIIAMPAAGNCLTSLTELDKHLYSLTIQLFESVKFMHDNNVTHMDLKPADVSPSSFLVYLSGLGMQRNFVEVLRERRDISHLRSEKLKYPVQLEFVPTCGQ